MESSKSRELRNGLSYIGSILCDEDKNMKNDQKELSTNLLHINPNEFVINESDEEIPLPRFTNRDETIMTERINHIEEKEKENIVDDKGECLLEHKEIIHPKEVRFSDEFNQSKMCVLTELKEPFIGIYPTPYKEISAKMININ